MAASEPAQSVDLPGVRTRRPQRDVS